MVIGFQIFHVFPGWHVRPQIPDDIIPEPGGPPGTCDGLSVLHVTCKSSESILHTRVIIMYSFKTRLSFVDL